MTTETDTIFLQLLKLMSTVYQRHDRVRCRLQDVMREKGISDACDLTVHECRVIRYIGEHDATNAITMASSLGISRGGISKICARLIAKKVITSHQMDGNRKEIFYRLTHLGSEIRDSHMEFNRNAENDCRSIIDSYSPQQKDVIMDFLLRLEGLL
ncbi:MAG: hypothetical protein IJ523_00865 [Succinivibrionaceae bacterium]|nr:hypothetical protein [Succinivibrionaceae bacterium]